MILRTTQKSNPFESPEIPTQQPLPRRVIVEQFKIEAEAFHTRYFSPDQIAETLEHEILTSCLKEGLELGKEHETSIHISGVITKIEDLNRTFRMIFPSAALKVAITVEGTIDIEGEPLHHFEQTIKPTIPKNPKTNNSSLKNLLNQFGKKVALEAASKTEPDADAAHRNAINYQWIVLLLAILFAAASAIFGYQFVQERIPNVRPFDVNDYYLMLALFSAAGFFMIAGWAITLAPTKILHNRSFYWLFSCNKSNGAIVERIVLAIVSLLPTALYFAIFFRAS